MQNLWENLDNISKTGDLLNLLEAWIYWIAVVVILVLIFYIAVKFANFVRKISDKKRGINDEESFM